MSTYDVTVCKKSNESRKQQYKLKHLTHILLYICDKKNMKHNTNKNITTRKELIIKIAITSAPQVLLAF